MDNETPNETEDLETKDVEAQETEVKEVAIVESDAEPENVEPEAPPPVVAERVAELVAASDLGEKAHPWVLAQTYADEAGVERAIEEMRVFIADLTPAGQPFALGETSAPAATDVPKLLTLEELEERARERTARIMKEIEPTYAGNM